MQTTSLPLDLEHMFYYDVSGFSVLTQPTCTYVALATLTERPGLSDCATPLLSSRAGPDPIPAGAGEAGAQIYNYQGAVLHAKTSVFDRCWSIIGSTNLDFQSLRRNDESNVGIFDKDFSRQMIDIFHNDLQSSVKIEEKIWSKRPLHQKFLEKFFSLIMKKL